MTPRAICVIDLDALEHNAREIQRLVGERVQICAVVKANAYGHGAIPVAKALLGAGVHHLAVTSLDEARELREAEIQAPILVLSGVQPGQVQEAVRLRIASAVWHPPHLEALADALDDGDRLRVHLKFDTGMRRLGADDPEELARAACAHPVAVEGVFSHLACADEPGHASVPDQLRSFHHALETLRSAGLTPPLRHLANSAGLLAGVDTHLDMVRPGLLLYGCVPGRLEPGKRLRLRPVMTFKTRILHVKQAPPGAGVGYGWTFETRRPTRLAILPVGYGQGYPRALSNRGDVTVRGQRAPVVGAISMDHITVDVTDIAGAAAGDEVILWGQDGPDVMDLAERAETIGYELLTRVSRETSRTYKGRIE